MGNFSTVYNKESSRANDNSLIIVVKSPGYTHVTGDMHRNAAEIVGDFMTELLGEEMEPWQSSKSGETAVST